MMINNCLHCNKPIPWEKGQNKFCNLSYNHAQIAMHKPSHIKGKNKGNGRHYRKQRYKEGKSF